MAKAKTPSKSRGKQSKSGSANKGLVTSRAQGFPRAALVSALVAAVVGVVVLVVANASNTQTVVNETFATASSNFTTLVGGTWAYTNGHLTLTNPAQPVSSAAVGNANYAIHKYATGGDFVESADFYVTPTTADFNDASLIFSWQDASNFMFARFNETNNGTSDGMFKVVAGVQTKILDFSATFKPGVLRHAVVTHTGDIYTVTVGGVAVGTVHNASLGAGGRFGLGTRNDSVYFDNFVVTIPASPPTPTPALTSAVPIPVAGAYWGAIKDPGSYPDTAGKLGDFSLAQRQKVMTDAEKNLGRKYDVDRQFYEWGDDPVAATNPTPNDYIKWSTVTEGHIMLINLSPTLRSGGIRDWAAIANGNDDKSYLHPLAASFKAWGKPAFFTFQHEPEGHICPGDTLSGCDLTKYNGTTAQYKAAWRHIVTLFRADGVKNLSYTWITAAYHWSYPNDYRYEPNAYPGDDVIDWMGVDPFNVVTNEKTGFTNMADWKELSALIDPWYTWAAVHNKPLMLTATGSREDPSNPNRRAQWFTTAHAQMKASYPKVKGVIYYDVNPAFETNNDWRIFSGPFSAVTAYKAWGLDGYFNTRNCNVTTCTKP